MFQTSHWHLLHKIFLLGRNRRILIQQLLTHLKHSRDKHKKFKSSVTVWHFKVGQPISDNELSASLLCSQNQPRRALHFPCYRSGSREEKFTSPNQMKSNKNASCWHIILAHFLRVARFLYSPTADDELSAVRDKNASGLPQCRNWEKRWWNSREIFKKLSDEKLKIPNSNAIFIIGPAGSTLSPAIF